MQDYKKKDTEKTWLKRLPKVETELLIIKSCNDTLQTINLLELDSYSEKLKPIVMNILLREFIQLDAVTQEDTSYKGFVLRDNE